MSNEYIAGSVLSVLRYPVKSMMGEELTAADVREGGLIGDRAFALIDNRTRKIASAKNPRKWARLFDCHASFVEPPRKGHPMPPVWIMLPDGSNITSDQPNANGVLSRLLERDQARAGENSRTVLSRRDSRRSSSLPDEPWIAWRARN